MTVIDRLISWASAKNAGDRISAEVRKIRNKYVGKMAVEKMPFGAYVPCKIVAISWEDTYYPAGGWSVRVRYTEGVLMGKESETSDKSLFFQSN